MRLPPRAAQRLSLRLIAAFGALLAVAGVALLSAGAAHAASGGVSDSQLATAIILPIIFVGAFASVMAWAVSARRTQDDSVTDKPMPWWRTGAWYGRRDAADE